MLEQLTIVISIAVAAALAALVTYLACRKLGQQRIISSEAAVTERDAAIGSLRSEITDARNALETERAALSSKIESLQSELLLAVSERARLEGEAEGGEDLRALLCQRAVEIEALNSKVVTLTQQVARAQAEADEATKAKTELVEAKERECKALLDEKQSHIEEQKRLLAEAELKLADTFDALSVKALTTVSEQFMQVAKATFEVAQTEAKGDLRLKQQAIEELLKPVAESIQKLQTQHEDMEKKRVSAFDSIEKGFVAITKQTDQLANALRRPITRGAWGEMNLKTILDNAGLTEGVHYDVQDTTEGEDGDRLRTDVIIHLPNGRDFIIDSKAPLDSYWDGMNADSETERKSKFAAHARQVREHMKRLSSKTYWSRYKAAPDCVVMFIPTEGAFQAAIEADPSLLTDAQSRCIYLANPMTLINMIHVTAYVLKEESLKQNAHQVQAAATELYERLSKFVGKFADLGRSLKLAVGKYNEATGSLEGRVLPQARKINALGVGGNGSLPVATELDSVPRSLSSLEARVSAAEELLAEVEA